MTSRASPILSQPRRAAKPGVVRFPAYGSSPSDFVSSTSGEGYSCAGGCLTFGAGCLDARGTSGAGHLLTSSAQGRTMASSLTIKVNGLAHGVDASLDTPLLYVLHNELHLHGPRFGCGLAQCGACSVLMDGKEIRSCVTPVAAVAGKSITTLEGLPALWASQRGATAAAPVLHPLQQAWIDLQVPQCGYCQNGMLIQAADLLATTKQPTDDQIRTAMNGHLCRCGTHVRVIAAIKLAATSMAKGGAG